MQKTIYVSKKHENKVRKLCKRSVFSSLITIILEMLTDDDIDILISNVYEKPRTKEKSRIYARIHLAVKSGKLRKPTQCEICGKEAQTEGHHKDYSKPLEVQWLCPHCHQVAHGKKELTSK